MTAMERGVVGEGGGEGREREGEREKEGGRMNIVSMLTPPHRVWWWAWYILERE